MGQGEQRVATSGVAADSGVLRVVVVVCCAWARREGGRRKKEGKRKGEKGGKERGKRREGRKERGVHGFRGDGRAQWLSVGQATHMRNEEKKRGWDGN